MGILIYSCFGSLAQEGWVLKRDKENIVIYTRESENDPLKEYRVKTIINSPLPEVYFFLTDLEYRPEWIDDCVGLEIIDTLDNGQIRYHTSYDIPWPLPDRDLVVIADLSFDTENRKAELLTKQTDFEYTLENGVIRMPRYREHVILEEIDSNRTRFTAEGFADPGGSLPAWVVNMFLVDGIYDSMIRTRQEIAGRK